MFFRWIPCQRCVPTNNFSKLCFNKQNCMFNIITFSMEFLRTVFILTCSENVFQFFDRFAFGKQWSNKLKVFGYLTVEHINWWNNYGFCRWNSFFFLWGWSFVDWRYLIKALINFCADGDKLCPVENKFAIDSLFIFYKQFGNDLIQPLSCYPVEILIIDLFYKLHQIIAISESSDKNLKLQMLFFDFFDHVWKQCLHFFYKLWKLRCFRVGIFINYAFKFVPRHFLAILVKQSTLTSIVYSFLADKSWLFAVRIYTK